MAKAEAGGVPDRGATNPKKSKEVRPTGPGGGSLGPGAERGVPTLPGASARPEVHYPIGDAPTFTHIAVTSDRLYKDAGMLAAVGESLPELQADEIADRLDPSGTREAAKHNAGVFREVEGEQTQYNKAAGIAAEVAGGMGRRLAEGAAQHGPAVERVEREQADIDLLTGFVSDHPSWEEARPAEAVVAEVANEGRVLRDLPGQSSRLREALAELEAASTPGAAREVIREEADATQAAPKSGKEGRAQTVRPPEQVELPDPKDEALSNDERIDAVFAKGKPVIRKEIEQATGLSEHVVGRIMRGRIAANRVTMKIRREGKTGHPAYEYTPVIEPEADTPDEPEGGRISIDTVHLQPKDQAIIDRLKKGSATFEELGDASATEGVTYAQDAKSRGRGRIGNLKTFLDRRDVDHEIVVEDGLVDLVRRAPEVEDQHPQDTEYKGVSEASIGALADERGIDASVIRTLLDADADFDDIGSILDVARDTTTLPPLSDHLPHEEISEDHIAELYVTTQGDVEKMQQIVTIARAQAEGERPSGGKHAAPADSVVGSILDDLAKGESFDEFSVDDWIGDNLIPVGGYPRSREYDTMTGRMGRQGWPVPRQKDAVTDVGGGAVSTIEATPVTGDVPAASPEEDVDLGDQVRDTFDWLTVAGFRMDVAGNLSRLIDINTVHARLAAHDRNLTTEDIDDLRRDGFLPTREGHLADKVTMSDVVIALVLKQQTEVTGDVGETVRRETLVAKDEILGSLERNTVRNGGRNWEIPLTRDVTRRKKKPHRKRPSGHPARFAEYVRRTKYAPRFPEDWEE